MRPGRIFRGSISTFSTPLRSEFKGETPIDNIRHLGQQLAAAVNDLGESDDIPNLNIRALRSDTERLLTTISQLDQRQPQADFITQTIPENEDRIRPEPAVEKNSMESLMEENERLSYEIQQLEQEHQAVLSRPRGMFSTQGTSPRPRSLFATQGNSPRVDWRL